MFQGAIICGYPGAYTVAGGQSASFSQPPSSRALIQQVHHRLSHGSPRALAAEVIRLHGRLLIWSKKDGGRGAFTRCLPQPHCIRQIPIRDIKPLKLTARLGGYCFQMAEDLRLGKRTRFLGDPLHNTLEILGADKIQTFHSILLDSQQTPNDNW